MEILWRFLHLSIVNHKVHLEVFLRCLTLKQTKKKSRTRTTENLLFSSSSVRNQVREKHTIFFSDPGLKKTQITSSDILHKINSTEAAKS